LIAFTHVKHNLGERRARTLKIRQVARRYTLASIVLMIALISFMLSFKDYVVTEVFIHYRQEVLIVT